MTPPTLLIDILVFLLGLAIVAYTLFSAVRTFVLPRSAPDGLTRFVFVIIRQFFNLRLRFAKTYEDRDRIMAYYAPVSLLLLLPFWLSLVLIGYIGMFWAIRPQDEPFMLSGSSLFTLGFAREESVASTLLTYSEATIGLLLVALLIAYLPTMYGAFATREHLVTLLEVYTGSPPSAIEMILRLNRIHQLGSMPEFWSRWETWFAEVAESHTTLAALIFFRSPKPHFSWVNAAGAVMDSGALILAAVDTPWEPNIALAIRSGYLCLQRIADFFSFSYDPHPTFPDEPISVTREDFEAALDMLEAAGVPLKADRDQAWIAFAGWRVNYDRVLLAIAKITMTSPSLWLGQSLLAKPEMAHE